jgi:hypothetical protein
MISNAQPLSAGNAIRLFIEPPTGALKWRILRKASDTFSDENDTGALVVYEGDEKVFIESAESLINEVAAYYRPYYWNGTVWAAGATRAATPSARYEDCSTDVLDTVCDRLRSGLLVEVQRGNFITDIGYIQVFTAPPSLERDIRFPVVTVSLDDESQEIRGLGEDIYGDELIDDDVFESEGWLARVRLTVTGWSQNPEERNELRKALRRIVVSNLPVFADKGMQLVQFEQQNSDAVSGEYDAPLFLTMGTFSCVAPVRVGYTTETTVTDIQIESI